MSRHVIKVPRNELGTDHAIGDVHGGATALREKLASLGRDDRLFLVGDLMDRGEDSAAIIRLIQEANRDKNQPVVYVTMGNHEEMFLKKMDAVNGVITGREADNAHADFIRNGGGWIYEGQQLIKGLDEIAKYVKTLPYYILIGNIKDPDARVICHADRPRNISDERLEELFQTGTLTPDEIKKTIWSRPEGSSDVGSPKLETGDEETEMRALTICGHNDMKNETEAITAIRIETNSVDVDFGAFKNGFVTIEQHANKTRKASVQKPNTFLTKAAERITKFLEISHAKRVMFCRIKYEMELVPTNFLTAISFIAEVNKTDWPDDLKVALENIETKIKTGDKATIESISQEAANLKPRLAVYLKLYRSLEKCLEPSKINELLKIIDDISKIPLGQLSSEQKFIKEKILSASSAELNLYAALLLKGLSLEKTEEFSKVISSLAVPIKPGHVLLPEYEFIQGKIFDGTKIELELYGALLSKGLEVDDVENFSEIITNIVNNPLSPDLLFFKEKILSISPKELQLYRDLLSKVPPLAPSEIQKFSDIIALLAHGEGEFLQIIKNEMLKPNSTVLDNSSPLIKWIAAQKTPVFIGTDKDLDLYNALFLKKDKLEPAEIQKLLQCISAILKMDQKNKPQSITAIQQKILDKNTTDEQLRLLSNKIFTSQAEFKAARNGSPPRTDFTDAIFTFGDFKGLDFSSCVFSESVLIEREGFDIVENNKYATFIVQPDFSDVKNLTENAFLSSGEKIDAETRKNIFPLGYRNDSGALNPVLFEQCEQSMKNNVGLTRAQVCAAIENMKIDVVNAQREHAVTRVGNKLISHTLHSSAGRRVLTVEHMRITCDELGQLLTKLHSERRSLDCIQLPMVLGSSSPNHYVQVQIFKKGDKDFGVRVVDSASSILGIETAAKAQVELMLYEIEREIKTSLEILSTVCKKPIVTVVETGTQEWRDEKRSGIYMLAAMRATVNDVLKYGAASLQSDDDMKGVVRSEQERVKQLSTSSSVYLDSYCLGVVPGEKTADKVKNVFIAAVLTPSDTSKFTDAVTNALQCYKNAGHRSIFFNRGNAYVERAQREFDNDRLVPNAKFEVAKKIVYEILREGLQSTPEGLVKVSNFRAEHLLKALQNEGLISKEIKTEKGNLIREKPSAAIAEAALSSPSPHNR